MTVNEITNTDNCLFCNKEITTTKRERGAIYCSRLCGVKAYYHRSKCRGRLQNCKDFHIRIKKLKEAGLIEDKKDKE